MTDQPATPQAPMLVVDPTGNLGTIDPAEAPSALSEGGFRMPTSEELHAYHADLKYGGGGNALKAFGAGALRGASLGLSDYALTHSGAVAPETLAGLKEAHSVASPVGEVGGVALGALATGGASAVGEGAVEGGAAAAGSLYRVGRALRVSGASSVGRIEGLSADGPKLLRRAAGA